MISVNIAFDNSDQRLGYFFRQCKEDLTVFLEDRRINEGVDYEVHEIHSGRCNIAYLDYRIPLVNDHNFLFIAYSHGNVDCLTAGGGSYVDSSSNGPLFNNSFFYSVACSVGAGLGFQLIDHGSHVFIGYKDSYNVLDRHLRLFVNCVNVGIKMFLMGENARESFRRMEQFYTQKIDELTRLNDILAAGFLVSNRNALVFLGREDVTIADFNV